MDMAATATGDITTEAAAAAETTSQPSPARLQRPRDVTDLHAVGVVRAVMNVIDVEEVAIGITGGAAGVGAAVGDITAGRNGGEGDLRVIPATLMMMPELSGAVGKDPRVRPDPKRITMLSGAKN